MNPVWVCPVCRDICNWYIHLRAPMCFVETPFLSFSEDGIFVFMFFSSICRPMKGWAPTGQLGRKARELGFASVAHYLINTYQRSRTDVPSGGSPLVPASCGKEEEMSRSEKTVENGIMKQQALKQEKSERQTKTGKLGKRSRESSEQADYGQVRHFPPRSYAHLEVKQILS